MSDKISWINNYMYSFSWEKGKKYWEKYLSPLVTSIWYYHIEFDVFFSFAAIKSSIPSIVIDVFGKLMVVFNIERKQDLPIV